MLNLNRRGFLRSVMLGMAAMMAAFPLAGHASPGAAQQGTLSLVQGPDPATYVYVEWGPDGKVTVLPPMTPSPWRDQDVMVRGMGIPLAEFPEFDARHGPVLIFDPGGNLVPPDEWTVAMIRAHYLYALGQRTPTVPLDGNHLSVRFMPSALWQARAYIDGEEVKHVTESYSDSDGWLVEMLGIFGQGPRIRIRAGNVELRVNGAPVHPAMFTDPLLG